MIIDTSRLRTSALRNKLRMAFSELSDQQLMDVHVFSFGFKHGMPVEADIMIDVRLFGPTVLRSRDGSTMTGSAITKWGSGLCFGPSQDPGVLEGLRLPIRSCPAISAEGKPLLSCLFWCRACKIKQRCHRRATARYLKAPKRHVSILPASRFFARQHVNNACKYPLAQTADSAYEYRQGKNPLSAPLSNSTKAQRV